MIKIVVKNILTLLFLTSGVYAKEIEAKKLCDSEIKKEVIDVSVVKEQCLQTAKFYEEKKEYSSASWYYLLAGENDNNINDLELKIPQNGNFSNIAHSYILKANLNKAKKLYVKFLKNINIPWADNATQDDYKLLLKLYPNKQERLQQGLALWNEIYKPLLEVNELYPKYKQARKDKKYKEAISYLRKIIDLMQNQFQDYIYYSSACTELGDLYRKTHAYDQSILFFKKAIKEYKKSKNLEKLYFAMRGLIAAEKEQYSFPQDYVKVQILKDSLYAIDIAKKLGKNGLAIGELQEEIAEFYFQNENYTQALTYFKKALEYRMSVEDDEYFLINTFSKNYFGIYRCYNELDNEKEANNWYQKISKIKNRKKPRVQDMYKRLKDRGIELDSSTYDALIFLESKNKNYDLAITYLQEKIFVIDRNLNKKVRQKDNLRLADLYFMNKSYIKSLKVYQKLLIGTNLLNKSELALIYAKIAFIYNALDQNDKAKINIKKSIIIYNNILDENIVHDDTFFFIGNQTFDFILSTAEAILKDTFFEDLIINKMLNIKYVYNENSDKYLNKYQILVEKNYSILSSQAIKINYFLLAKLFFQLDNDKKALKYFEKTLLFSKNDNTVRRSTYFLMGTIYENNLNYKQVDLYYQKVIPLDKNNLYIQKILESYNWMALSLMDVDKFSLAQKFLLKGIHLAKKSYNDDYLDMLYSNYIGFLYFNKNYKEAIVYAEKLVNLEEENIALSYNIEYAYRLLGLLYKQVGQNKKATFYINESLKKYNDKIEDMWFIYGDSSFKLLSIYQDQANTYTLLENYTQAYKIINKAFKIYLDKRNQVFEREDKEGKKRYIESNRSIIEDLLNISYSKYTHSKNSRKTSLQKITITSLNSWLNYKGAIYDSENTMVVLYEATKDKNLKATIDELMQAKRDLAKLYQTIPRTQRERATYKTIIKESEKKITDLENKIASKASKFKEELGLRNIDYKDISKNLKENELYIDYAKAGECYYIFTLDAKNNITFNRIDTNTTKRIDNNIKEFRQDLNIIVNSSKITQKEIEKLQQHSKKLLSNLYGEVLKKPLKDILPYYSSLIISTDGTLRLLPFETMFNIQTEKYLIEEKNIRYIPSGKELVRLYRFKTKTKNEKLVLFDNPNFDVKGVTIAQTNTLQTPFTNRSGIIKSLFKMRFLPLPWTNKEAENIKQEQDPKYVQEFTEDNASEANLFQVNSPKILHIATHGFFINDNNIPNPMLKSGIALSGANFSAKRGKDNGIATSLKLLGLNLKGTKLVVLSACQTGIVDPNSTESVSGLNKAFMQAGTKNIVLSLWSVADKETSDLMSSFYKEMKDTPDYAEALRKSKLKMIKQNLHPFYWGAFVLSGLGSDDSKAN